MEGMIQELALNRIVESKTNPRRVVAGPALETLIESVKQVGVIQPLLVRPIEVKANGPGTYDAFELVAGHRRLAAAKAAGLDSVPAMSRVMNDQEVLEIQVVENLQRADLHPLEEAEGYRQLMHVHKYDVARIAERIGRSAKYVYDRVKLLQLTKEAQQLFLSDRFTPGHAVILARLKPADQERAIGTAKNAYDDGSLFLEERTLFDADAEGVPPPLMCMKPISVRELQSWVDGNVRFDARAADNIELFPHTYLDVKAADGKKRKIVPITKQHYIPPETREKARTFHPQSWKRADGKKGSKSCSFAVTGVIVVGPGRGDAFDVCVEKKKCSVHWPAPKGKAKAKSGGLAADRGKKDHEKQEAERQRWLDAMPALLEALAAKVRKAPAGPSSPIAKIVVEALTENYWGAHRKDVEKLVPTGKSAEDVLRHLAMWTLFCDLRDGYDIERLVKPFGVDARKIRDQVAPVQTSAKAPGTCSKCGCTEDAACPGGCAWANKEETLCTSCAPTKASARKPTARPPAKKKAAPAAKPARPRGKKK